MQDNPLLPPPMLLVDPPQVSDEVASEILNFLYELVNAFEHHYANQLRRYHESTEPPQPDPFDFDDELPSF
jgi:hypothetical protein